MTNTPTHSRNSLENRTRFPTIIWTKFIHVFRSKRRINHTLWGGMRIFLNQSINQSINQSTLFKHDKSAYIRQYPRPPPPPPPPQAKKPLVTARLLTPFPRKRNNKSKSTVGHNYLLLRYMSLYSVAHI